MRIPITFSFLLALAGCERQAASIEDADLVLPGDDGTHLQDADAGGDPAGEDGEPVAEDTGAILAAAQGIKLPVGWLGTGVLAKRSDKAPRGSPSWARVLAEVVERDGRRFLETTGRAERIKNKALARTTAENRARAEMTRWVVSDQLAGSALVASWQHPKSGVTYARLALPVPAGWTPGQPLSAAEDATDSE